MKGSIFLLGMLVLILLASCGQPSTPPPTPTNTPVPPTPTLTPSPTPTPVPPGPRVVFVSNRGGDENSQRLYILDVETGEITLLDTGFDNVAFPRWSPDGRKILFTVKDIWNLYTINADGSNLTQITDFRSNNADWSPDGTRIVFQSDYRDEPENTPDIYVMDITGENLVKIVENLPAPDFNPRWSRAGNRIMFISGRTGNLEIFLVNPDGSNVTQVTVSGSPITNASISPDGERVAFVYPRGSKFTDLYTVDKSGAVDSAVRLTRDDTLDDAPSWLPDGKKLVYYSDKSGNFDLWIINADGTNPLQLTNDEHYDAYPDYWTP